MALCDVDDVRSAAVMKRYDKVPKYKDFRKMLDKENSGIDAVIVAIPDHMHATAAMHAWSAASTSTCRSRSAARFGKRTSLQEAANKYKVATQMGNQGYSNEGTRQCAEMIWSGAIGEVTEVHAWTDRPIWPQGVTEIPAAGAGAVHARLGSVAGDGGKARLHRGGAAYEHNRYGHFYQPFNWRGFFDFGCGALGDMACHILGAPNLALKLGTPTSVECIKKEGTSAFQFPKSSVIRFDFPARGNMPPVKLYWHDGLKEQPKIRRAGWRVAGRPAALGARGGEARAVAPRPPGRRIHRRRLQIQ